MTRKTLTSFAAALLLIVPLAGQSPALAGNVSADATTTAAPSPDDLAAVLAWEQRRVDLVERISPAVVCVYDRGQRGGGSGVLIDSSGVGLTNYHVVAGLLRGGPHSGRGWGGLSDGRLYELEVLGIDPTGDVAMFRLHGRDDFPSVPLGDSDAVRLGDSVLALGNPFVLSEDHTPTVTAGVITGVHRYQWGQGNSLVYSDCLQTDAPVNPGNSGGPLFNARGEVIGINGRISINARGRYNVGFGYAISSNQIKRYIPALRAGLLAAHGTLQATVVDRSEGVIFNEIVRQAPAYDAGVRVGDRLIALNGQPIRSRNHFASFLGTLPAGQCVALTTARDGVVRTALTRLEPLPVRLQSPFPTNEEANQREMLRVVRRFRATLGSTASTGLIDPSAPTGSPDSSDSARPSGSRDVEFRWRIARHASSNGEDAAHSEGSSGVSDRGTTSASPKAAEFFEIVLPASGPAIQRELATEKGAPIGNRDVHFSAAGAWREVEVDAELEIDSEVRAEADAEAGSRDEANAVSANRLPLRTDDRLVLSCWCVWHLWLAAASEAELMAAPLHHAGGDVHFEGLDGDYRDLVEHPLEVIEADLGDGAIARCYFFSDSGQLQRLEAYNPAGVLRVTLHPGPLQPGSAGRPTSVSSSGTAAPSIARWPAWYDVHTPTGAYRDTYLPAEVQP
jgi:S1-C subfamily serine protease